MLDNLLRLEGATCNKPSKEGRGSNCSHPLIKTRRTQLEAIAHALATGAPADAQTKKRVSMPSRTQF